MNAPITNAAVSGMPRAQAGTASAVASTSRQVGASLGVALAGSIAGEALSQEFASSTHAFWWLVLALGGGIVALGVLSTGARAKASAERIAYLLDARGDAAPPPAQVSSAPSGAPAVLP